MFNRFDPSIFSVLVGLVVRVVCEPGICYQDPDR